MSCRIRNTRNKLSRLKANHHFDHDVVKKYFDEIEWENLEKDAREEMLLKVFEKIFLNFRFVIPNAQMYDTIYCLLMHELYVFFNDCKKKEIWCNMLKKYNVEIECEFNFATLQYFDNYWVKDKEVRKEILFYRTLEYFDEKIDNKKIIDLLETYITNKLNF